MFVDMQRERFVLLKLARRISELNHVYTSRLGGKALIGCCLCAARRKRVGAANKILSLCLVYRWCSLHQREADEPTSANTWPPAYLSTSSGMYLVING